MTLPSNRQAGVCLHITSLPGDYGVGEIGHAARQFIDTLSSMGMRVWQFLPIGPTAYGNSPYQPLSIYAGNTVLLDVASLVEAGLVQPGETTELADLPSEHTEYGRVVPLKQQVLARAADRFATRASAAQRLAYDEFLAQHEERWLHDYALFRVLKTLHQERAWPEWDLQYVNRDADALRSLARSARQQIDEVKVLQFLFFEQWHALRAHAHDQGIRLFGDIPLYIALDSADAWTSPELLQIDRDGRPQRVAGVPPDYFSADGQLWGNPLYEWEYHAKTNYQWWIERVRHAVTLADIIRLDHFRGFESYWSIPASADTARDGQWLAGPGNELFDALRAALGDLPFVAEDLGIITDAVTALSERQQLPGMKVLQFMLGDKHFDVHQIPGNSVCYTGTHDNDTTVGWFSGGPDDVRSLDEIRRTQGIVLHNTRGSPETIHTDVIRLALQSEARLTIVLMQDFLGLGSEARMNTPGTTKGNWRWRLMREQINDSLCHSIREMVVASGRSA